VGFVTVFVPEFRVSSHSDSVNMSQPANDVQIVLRSSPASHRVTDCVIFASRCLQQLLDCPVPAR
jgi:hypothetical protein